MFGCPGNGAFIETSRSHRLPRQPAGRQSATWGRDHLPSRFTGELLQSGLRFPL